MTEQDQIIEIAKLDGWNYEDHCLCQGCLELNNKSYLTSRDAIVPVIEKQSWPTKVAIAGIICSLKTNSEVEYSPRVATMLATPSQLSEALLRATNKWKE